VPLPSNPVQGSLFEENYLVRTLGSIASSADVALTELVANGWDAGATRVDITVPSSTGQLLVVTDDGAGLTPEQFRHRWMTLGYNRVRHQGLDADFPPERHDFRRRAYGRNGVGRHGLLCFGDTYEVETRRDGAGARFVVGITSGRDPFVLRSEQRFPSTGHGTKLSVTLTRHLPDSDKLLDVLSARFLHDPNFAVGVNGRTIPLEKLPGLLDQTVLDLGDGGTAKAIFFDSTKGARTTRQQGIAFWVGGRLVGAPSWVLGTRPVIDGRTSIAKRYTAIVTTDALFDDVLSDWSGFKATPRVMKLFDRVHAYVHEQFRRVSRERADETREGVLRDFRTELEQLQPLARLEISEFVEEIAASDYEIPPETMSVAVRAVINLEKSKSGIALLEKLAQLSEEDVGALDRILSEWSARDALAVLDEIDRRLAVLEGLSRLSADKNVDELKTLHPLVTQARWLFGPEFESAEYASNVSLRRAVEKVFGRRIDADAFENYRRRPDLLLLSDATLAALAVDEFESGSGLAQMRDVLLIELKRGGHAIGREEMNQAIDYVEELLACGLLDSAPYIRAFVVGHEVRNGQLVRKLGENPERGTIRATTYSQLIRTAEQRLFRLRDRLRERYGQVAESDLLSKIFSEPRQMEFRTVEAEA